ncbi:hypothetical protein RhiJN_18240 [Ceratobasidium sp. AG-Ba]|nr:hypothetical protein RhiJN_18240 [Ceratobasidium sp. AG-Ba]
MSCPDLNVLSLRRCRGKMETIGFVDIPTRRSISKKLFMHSFSSYLASIQSLICISVSSDLLDVSCWESISTWPMLKTLRIFACQNLSFPILGDSAFPVLDTLKLSGVQSCETIDVIWKNHAFVSRLTSVILVLLNECFDKNNILGLERHVLEVLIRKTPRAESLKIDIPQVFSGLNIPISSLTVLEQLPLRILKLDGVCLDGRGEVLPRLLEFSDLEILSLRHQEISIKDLQYIQEKMPYLRTLRVAIKSKPVVAELIVNLSQVARYRQSPPLILELNFLRKGRFSEEKDTYIGIAIKRLNT